MSTAAVTERIALDREKLAGFCRKWRITELALFGSVLREDFGPASDVDVLVTFATDAPWSLWDFAAIRSELAQILGRRIDLIEKKAIRNPFVRHEVLTTQVVIYAA
jgi:hypothetical protein